MEKMDKKDPGNKKGETSKSNKDSDQKTKNVTSDKKKGSLADVNDNSGQKEKKGTSDKK